MTCTIVFLDLPPGTTLTIDGRRPLQLASDRDAPSLVGVRAIPANGGGFHLVTLRCGSNTNTTSCTTHGFVLVAQGAASSNDELYCVHRYDPNTEEVGGAPVDSATYRNVVMALREAETNSNTSNQAKILLAALPTHDALETLASGSNQQQQQPDWSTDLAEHITPDLLRLRGLQLNEDRSVQLIKLVPGVLPQEDGEERTSTTYTSDDAQSLVYPPIPVFPLQHNHQHKATSHAGTRTFLRQLPPPERTAYYRTEVSTERNVKALEYLLEHSYQDSFSLLLGDLQLSFLLFWQLQCFASLTHWRDLASLLGHSNGGASTSLNTCASASAADILGHQLAAQHDFLDEYQDSALVAALYRLGRHSTESGGWLRSVLQRQGLVDAVTVLEDNASMDEDDEDGPLIVEDVEYADAVTPSLSHNDSVTPPLRRPPPLLTERYPILAAAMLEHEDVLMTCARALDTQVDVGVVREAAAYLQEQEAGTAAG